MCVVCSKENAGGKNHSALVSHWDSGGEKHLLKGNSSWNFLLRLEDEGGIGLGHRRHDSLLERI